MLEHNQQPSETRVGLIAGWGGYPLVIARALRRQGVDVYCLAVAGYADPALREICHDFRWIGLARFGAAIRHFQRHGVRRATMAGKIHKGFMFQPWFWLRLVPDLPTVRAFLPHFLTRQRDCKDDTLLGRVVQLFADAGIELGPASDYAPELLVPAGPVSRLAPTPRQWKDIRFGWTIAKELGRLDIGQSVAVKSQAVLAVEAVEGTDQCIRRAGALCPAGEITVVKVAKPQQDMRFDVPTIGLGTLESMVAAGARVLAVEAGRTIILDGPDVVAFADRHKLVLVAVDEDPTDRSDT
jgi:DUF1009 family protein